MFDSDFVINQLDTLLFNYICSMHKYSDIDMQSTTSVCKRKKICRLY